MSEAQTTAQPAISKPVQNRKKRGVGIYMQNVLTRKVSLPFKSIGSNLVENIEK